MCVLLCKATIAEASLFNKGYYGMDLDIKATKTINTEHCDPKDKILPAKDKNTVMYYVQSRVGVIIMLVLSFFQISVVFKKYCSCTFNEK